MYDGSKIQDGREAFDFFIGRWDVRHRRLNARLVGCRDWTEFGGFCETRKILRGQGNMDDNVLDLPGDRYAAVTTRLFDPGTRLWSIYWIDARHPVIDPPMHGRFENGVGLFYGEDVFEGRPIRVRSRGPTRTRPAAAGPRPSPTTPARPGRPTGRWTSPGLGSAKLRTGTVQLNEGF